MSAFDFLSPFEELVVAEAGHGSDEMEIQWKAEDLAGRRIPLFRVTYALQMLELDGCVYSWPAEPETDPEKQRLVFEVP